MLTMPPSGRVFVCLTPADMRRSRDGLAALTREVLKEDPRSGHRLVFFNRRRDRVKILRWDRSGLCRYYKRIEKGGFRRSSRERPNRIRPAIEAAELLLIREGIDLHRSRGRRRFVPREMA
ncbi:MAG: IS66 family insertion sequence element accessory protein TnpB [Planctomycetota bacterium]